MAMINNDPQYEKPAVVYWHAEELNRIEAKMSGGGGGGGGSNFYYQWDQKPKITETDDSVKGLAVSIVVGILAAVATRNAALGTQVIGSAVSAVAGQIVSSGVEVVYYKTYEYLLRAQPYNSSSGVGYVAGQALVTEYYEDRLRKVAISKPSMYTNVSSDLSYMLQRCPGYNFF